MTTPMTISGPRCWWCKEAWQFNKYLRWPRPSSEPDPDPPGPKNLRNFLRRAEGRASSWFSLFIYELLWPVAVTSSQGGLEGRWGRGRGRVSRLRTLAKPSQVKCQKSENSLGECLFSCLCVRAYGCRLSRCLFFFFGDPISSGPLFIYCRTATAAAAPSSCCHNKKPSHTQKYTCMNAP